MQRLHRIVLTRTSLIFERLRRINEKRNRARRYSQIITRPFARSVHWLTYRTRTPGRIVRRGRDKSVE